MDLHTSLVSFNITSFFFFNDTATTEIYTLSLHDALPILLLDDVTLKNTTGATKTVSWFEYWDVNPYNQEIASPGTRGVGQPTWNAQTKTLQVTQSGGGPAGHPPPPASPPALRNPPPPPAPPAP